MTPAPIVGVQPGGHGIFVRLELAWGGCRRWLLRRGWPGYVTRMQAVRQGDDRTGRFNVIDSRDLKFCRNVCGWWFRPEDDAFAWRDRLGFARHGFAELVGFSFLLVLLAIGIGAAAAAVSPYWAWLLVVPALLTGEVLWFFRDPARTIPSDPGVLVSPADGVITHIEEIADADFPDGRALRISIFLSIFSVHINRLPCTGEVIGQRYFPGAYFDARNPASAERNEQNWLDLRDSADRLVRVKQISGAIARRIVCWPRLGETLPRGGKFGLIKFGSRTDLLVPVGFAVCVGVGQGVYGGVTVLLREPTAD